jgi:hypothetical protein
MHDAEVVARSLASLNNMIVEANNRKSDKGHSPDVTDQVHCFIEARQQ